MTLRMLIVDDEEPILKALSGYFDLFGYEIDCARDLVETEQFLDSRRYDVVLADLRLSGIDGVEGLDVVSFVRARFPQTRIALLSAYGTPAIRKEASNRGADAFLDKPQPLSEIARIVGDLVSTAARCER